MYKQIVSVGIVAAAFLPLLAHAQTNTSSSGTPPARCPAFDRTITLGATGDDVSALQEFLAEDTSIYPEGLVTGYFGPLTEAAVKRWQARNGIVSAGDSNTTGWGLVGPRTRALIAIKCGGGNSSNSPTTPASNTNTTPSSGTVRADIKANGSDGSLNVSSGLSASISWASANAQKCTLRNGVTGTVYDIQTAGSGNTYPITQENTYTLTCVSADGRTVSDSVTIKPSSTTAPTNTTCPAQMAPQASECNGTWEATTYTSSSGCALKNWICVPKTTTPSGCPIYNACPSGYTSKTSTASNGCTVLTCVSPTQTNTDTTSCPIYNACPPGYTSKTSTGVNGCTVLECIPSTSPSSGDSINRATTSFGAAAALLADGWVGMFVSLWNFVSGQ